MKRIQLRQMLLVLAVALAIVGGGILTPSLAMDRQRAEALRATTVVSAEEVHPYGEAYEAAKATLLSELRLIYAMNRGGELDEILLEQANTAQQQAYETGLEELRRFFTQLQTLIPELNLSLMAEDTPVNQALYRQEEGGVVLCAGEWSSKEEGSYGRIFFSAESGIPLDLSLYLPTEELSDLQTVVEEIVAVYEQFTGTTFLQRDISQNGIMDAMDAAGVGSAETDAVAWAYSNLGVEAVSADSAFSLWIELDYDGAYLGLTISMA